jgi:hypothetical protein
MNHDSPSPSSGRRAGAGHRALAPLLAAFLVGAAFAGAQPAAAQHPGSGPVRVVSQTRGIAVFSGLEAELAGALSRRDRKATDRLLSQDFEYREAASEGETARGDWIASPGSRAGGELTGLSVHEFPDLAVVSFTRVGAPRAGLAPRAYIVDVWQRASSGWQLLARYQAGLAPAPMQKADPAPTGKG